MIGNLSLLHWFLFLKVWSDGNNPAKDSLSCELTSCHWVSAAINDKVNQVNDGGTPGNTEWAIAIHQRWMGEPLSPSARPLLLFTIITTTNVALNRRRRTAITELKMVKGRFRGFISSGSASLTAWRIAKATWNAAQFGTIHANTEDGQRMAWKALNNVAFKSRISNHWPSLTVLRASRGWCWIMDDNSPWFLRICLILSRCG